MGVLLDAWRVVDPDGKQKLTLVHVGGKIETIDAPFLPYFYMLGASHEVEAWLKSHKLPYENLRNEPCVALSDLDQGPKMWTKVEVKNVNGVTELNKIVDDNERTQRYVRFAGRPQIVVAENHLGFVERVMADRPGWLDSFTDKTADDVTVIWVDIEQSQERIGVNEAGEEIMAFPEVTDPIIAITYKVKGPGALKLPENERARVLLMNDEDLKNERHVGGAGVVKSWDKRILTEFARIVKLVDPDGFAGYNLHEYDLPMLSARSVKVGIGNNWMVRGKGSPRVEEDKVGTWEKTRTSLRGRFVYDVFERVWLDQSLNGKTKDRGLKTVAEYRGLPVLRMDTTNTMKVWRERRHEIEPYGMSDVDLAIALGEPYWRNWLMLRDMMQAPLRFIVDSSANFYGTRLSAEDFQYAPAAVHNGCRVLSDGTNYRRFQHLADHAACPRSKKGRPIIVTGARVRFLKSGHFGPKEACAVHASPTEGCERCMGTWKVDVGAMYPSIIETYGLSPDNVVHAGFDTNVGMTFFARVLPGSPVPHGIDAWREYYVPDPEWGGCHIIRVYGRGKLSQRITQAKANRKAIKKQMDVLKEAGKKNSLEYKLLDGQQDALKVWQNSVFGNNANEYARYGNYIVSMMITGIGRLVGEIIESTLGDSAIEVDTDGVYASKPTDVTIINRAIDHVVKERSLLDQNTIKVELDEYVQSYFHSAKNYVLLEADGRIVKHGSAIMGAKHCSLWDEAVETAVRERFGLVPTGSFDTWRETVSSSLRSGTIPLKLLTQRVSVKEIAEYGHDAQGKQIALSHVQVYKRPPPPNTKVTFLYTKLGVEVLGAPGIERRIDVKHYVSLLNDVRDLFRLGRQVIPTKLSDFC